LAGCHRPADLDQRPLIIVERLGVLDHDNGVGAARHHPPGGNQRGRSRRNRKLRLLAGGQDFVIDRQDPRRALAGPNRVVGAQREPIDTRAIEPGNIDLGDDGAG